MNLRLGRVITLLLLLTVFGLRLTYAQAETVVTLCDYQQVSKAIATGGVIVLDCDRVLEVWADRPLTIAVNTTLKPAEGRKITFSALKGRAFVVNEGITFWLENVTIKGKDGKSGGIENNGGNLQLSNINFSNNNGAAGAALGNHEAGTATIQNSLFSNNQTFAGGGAIFNDAKSEITIADTLFVNNHAWSDSNGGAIFNRGTMSISSSTFKENDAQGRFGWGGAILNTQDGALTVINTTFNHNTAGHSGGAIRNDVKGKTTIQFSTFVENNTGVWGGALYVEGGELNVSSSLFSRNLANGTANDCGQTKTLAAIKADHNLSKFGCGETAATGVATLGNNGGLTQTVAVAANSNAIDAAGECPSSAIDQRGVTRPQGEGCDIGAFEYVELTTAATAVDLCQITTTRDVRLREEPNTASAILAVVPHNSTFQAIEQVAGWYHITYGIVNGWVSAEFATTKGVCGG